MHPETLPLLASTLVAYVAIGAGMLFRVRRRQRSQLAARTHAHAALRAG